MDLTILKPFCSSLFIAFTNAVIECEDLPNPENGQVTLSGTTPGSTATYICNNGFMLQGVSSRNCMDDGEWSGEAPTCVRKYLCKVVFTHFTNYYTIIRFCVSLVSISKYLNAYLFSQLLTVVTFPTLIMAK